jgi:hypothetical protein
VNNRLGFLAAGFAAILWSAAAAWSHTTLQGFTVTQSPPTYMVLTSTGTQAARPVGAGATWPVTVDQALLASQPQTVILNFPDRASATLTRMISEQRGQGGFLWTGQGNGCTVVFSAWSTGFRGVISCLNANYGIDLTASGSAFQLTRYDAVPGAQDVAWEGPPIHYAAPLIPASVPNATAQADTVIDILVLYTEAVRHHFDPAGGKGNTLAFMRQCVDMTKAAMVASTTVGTAVIAQVNFVGAQEVARTENGDDFTGDLLWMNDPTQEAAKWRAFYAADVVVYMTEDTGLTYGQSNQPKVNNLPAPGMPFAPYASSVLMRSHAMNDDSGAAIPQPYVFAHEFAHTLGADHDYGNAVNQTTPVQPWSYGHWAHNAGDGGGARTIMSYYTTPCAPSPPSCPRLLNYSNHGVTVDWFTTGVQDQQENSRTIALDAPGTALYQTSLGRIFYDGFQP